ncbi:zinc finger protein 155 isoform X13 [Aethina tumida]|uniref:zinc finger protein 155 isoform X13 n=1 Tax=Aethina tumida TaxID=116153 RepID=UPI002147A3B0|nr:zinc finger protein 155 isoform X13 [Aethina tumida]
MDNGGDILQLCRLCLVKDQVNIPIFEEQGDIRQIFLKISSCLPVKVTPDDKLPKKICDGCSCKLDMLYEFWNTTANAEKQLVSWLDQAGLKANTETADQTMSVVAQQVSSKPSETVVKEEAADEIFMEEITFSEKWEEASSSAGPSATITSDEPPPKRARRAAAVRASLNVAAESDDEDDLDTELTKIEDESEDEDDAEVDDPSYVDAPSTSADDQPGPSGVGKDGGDAPLWIIQLFQTAKSQKCKGYHLGVVCSDIGKFRCLLCNEHFANIELLVAHELSHSSDTFSCRECNENFTNLLSIKHHIRQHEGYGSDAGKEKVSVMCDICGKAFPSDRCMRRHKNFKHCGKIQCDCCHKTFGTEDELQSHLQKYVDTDICCPECGDFFHTKSGLSYHMRNKHISSMRCDICYRVYKSKERFAAHLQIHIDKVLPRIIQCGECQDKIEGVVKFKLHMKTVHDGGKCHVCDICGKSVSSKTTLRQHIDAHNNVKPFQCTFCGKRFTRTKNLLVHERIHTKQKTFECKECHKVFTQRTSLSIHFRRVHLGSTPFQCLSCKRGFVLQSILNQHLKTCCKFKQLESL